MDNWFSEFESTAVANQEAEEAKQRIFQGLLKGEALKWYQDVPVWNRNDWDQLTTAFLQAFLGSRWRSKSARPTEQDDHEDIRIRAEVWATDKGSYPEVNHGDLP
jgi:hypothetical protein